MGTLLCTFNVNNLFARYRFDEKFPGDLSGKSTVNSPGWGYLPTYNLKNWELWDAADRELAVRAITQDGHVLPDILCLIEVENMLALRKFNEDATLLKKAYKHALLIDSHDMRQIDVALLTNKEILDVRTHMDDPDPGEPGQFIFSRDCLEIELALDGAGSRSLTLFLNHLKSQFGTGDKAKAQSDARRRRQAQYVDQLVHQRFPGSKFMTEWFAVLGDFNAPASSNSLEPLVQDHDLKDVVARIPAAEQRWTEWYRGENSVSQLDYIMVSPALDAATSGQLPVIERRGIGYKSKYKKGGYGPAKTHFQDGGTPIDLDFQFPRFAGVDEQHDASDHCPVFFELPA